MKLARAFYTRADAVAVARRLLGHAPGGAARATGGAGLGIIVETEAYRGPEDRASHAYAGRRTRRTETMYAHGGTAYVYFVYGMYHQFNVVTNVADVPHAVLVRALEPVEGVELMRRRRGGVAHARPDERPGQALHRARHRPPPRRRRPAGRPNLARGGAVASPPAAIAAGPRVGIDYAEEWVDAPVALLAPGQSLREPVAAAALQTRRRTPLRWRAHMRPHQSSTYASA